MNRSSLLLPLVSTLATTDLAPATPTAPSTDEGRATQIRQFLQASPRMEGSRLEVEVRDHLATLRGEVLSIDQAEWAAATVYATDDVYGAIQIISLSPSALDPESLQEEVQHMLQHAPSLEGVRLSAQVSDDFVLTLSGQVGTPDELQAARELASRIDGLRQIVISASFNPLLPRRAAAIEAHLALLQQDDPLLAHLPVEFRLDQGHLIVGGFVGNDEQRERLLGRSMLSGVMSCDPRRLRMDPQFALNGMSDKRYFPSDAAKVMRLVFDADSRIDADDITIEIEDGRLVLLGEVSTELGRQAALQDCRGLPGVLGVRSELKVVPSVIPALSQN